MLKQLLARKTDFTGSDEENKIELHRTLGPWGVTALGISSIIGTGIFVITGQVAAEQAGPAILISFLLAAICSGLTALCYCEFATLIPISGSSYSYAYATLGEGLAWFIGWNMVLEYGISASAVVVSCTGYLNGFISQFGLHIPSTLASAPLALVHGHLVSTGAFLNLPALLIVLTLTWLCYVGIRESAGINMLMVALKVGLILVVVFVGWHYVDTANWHPFIPAPQGDGKFGWHGVIRGTGTLFFAYIGFEATTTAAQECKNPQRDLPIGILVSLVVCTILYLAMAAVLTGMTPYTMLNTIEPVITAIQSYPQLAWLREVVYLGALIALVSATLVMIIAQPRIFMVMSHDGLLPKVFGRIHPRYRTPHINTVITGISIAVAAAIFPLDLLINIISMGTLLTFLAVCIGVLILRYTAPELPRTFRVPWVWVICVASTLTCLMLLSSFEWSNWIAMAAWTGFGLLIYFGYGYRHSRLRRDLMAADSVR